VSVDPFHVDITWRAISPRLRAAIEGACTPKQVHVVMLHAAGYGPREASRYLGVTHRAFIKSREAALTRIRLEVVTKPPIPEGGLIND